MTRHGCAAAMLAFVLASAPAAATTPQTWRVSGVDGWKETERTSVGITSDGAVALSREVANVDGLDAFVVWDLLKEGNTLLAATGDQGALFRIGADGKATEVLRVIQPEITALGRDGRGRVLLGTSPDGQVYRLEGERALPVIDTPEDYVWRILPDGREGALLATGNEGKVYRWDGAQGLEVLFDAKASHVTGLVAEGDGWLLTTDSPGRLLRLAPGGSVEVLYDAEEGELRAPTPDGQGSIYFLANPEGAPGRLYRRAPSGAVERIWESLGPLFYALALGSEGTLWVSAGADTGAATITQVRPGPPSSWFEAVRVADLQAPCLVLENSEPKWLGSGNRGHVHRVGGAGTEGTAVSVVRDARSPARWGVLTVEPRAGAGPVKVETRTGQTRKPDASWSPWASVALTAREGKVASPAARFIQWRVTLSDPATRVSAVQVVYLPANLAPRVQEVDITDLGEEFEPSWDRGQPSSLAQQLPGGVRVEFQVPSGRGGPPTASDEDAAWARRYRSLSWKAVDPNDDPLRFDLEIRAPGDREWKTAKKDVESSPWVWDSATLPDGWYELRVTASDRPANPPGEELSAYRTTDVFLVDNTAPSVVDLAVERGNVTGRAVDATSPLKKLEMSVDGGTWRRVFPEDGIPDSREETFRVTAEAQGSGEHVVVVRVFDLAGNVGTGRVRFETP